MMWSYLNRGESHYREVLSETADHMVSYLRGKAAVLAECMNLKRPDPGEEGRWVLIYKDYFSLIELEIMPEPGQEDIFFGKGNECILVSADSDSLVGKGIYCKAFDYAVHLLSMFKEKYDAEDHMKVEYDKYYGTGILYMEFYIFAAKHS